MCNLQNKGQKQFQKAAVLLANPYNGFCCRCRSGHGIRCTAFGSDGTFLQMPHCMWLATLA